MTSPRHPSLNRPLNLAYTSTLPSDRPLKGKDIAQWRQTMNISSADICWLLSLPSTKWGLMTKHDQDEPVHHEIELLIRVWDANPHLIPLPEKVSVKNLVESLGVTPSDIGLLLGREEISGTRWVRNDEGDVHSGQTQTPLSQRLTLAVYQLSENNQRNHYYHLVRTVGLLRGIPDVMKNRTWKTRAEKRIGKIRRLVNSSAKMLATTTSLSSSEKNKYLKIQTCSQSWVEISQKLNDLKPKIQDTQNESARLHKFIEKKPQARAAFTEVTAKLNQLIAERDNFESELVVLETTLESILGPELDGKLFDSAKAQTLIRRMQKLRKLPSDTLVNRYAACVSEDWIQHDTRINELRAQQSAGTSEQSIPEIRDEIDDLTSRKNAIEQSLELILGPKFDYKPKKSSASERLTRQLHQLAKKNETFAFTSDPYNNSAITEFVKSKAAKWLDISVQIDALQPELIILNDKEMIKRLGTTPEEHQVKQSVVLQLTESAKAIEDKLQSLLGGHFDTVRYRTPELLAKVRQINQWKSAALNTLKLVELTAEEERTNKYVVEQTSIWLKTLESVEEISPINLINESNELTHLQIREHDFIERMAHIFSTLQKLERVNNRTADESRLFKKIEQIRNNAINYLNMSDGEESTSEVKVNEQVLKQCNIWFDEHERLASTKPLAIIEEAIQDTHPETDTHALDSINETLRHTFGAIMSAEANLKSLLGNKLNGKVERSEEEIKEQRKVSRLAARAEKIINESANDDDVQTPLTEEEKERWIEVLEQANAWQEASSLIEVNKKHQLILRSSGALDAESRQQFEALKLEEQQLVTRMQRIDYSLLMLLKSKYEPSYQESEKAFNKIKRKVSTLVLSAEAESELTALVNSSTSTSESHKAQNSISLSVAANNWLAIREEIDSIQFRLAIHDSKTSRLPDYVNEDASLEGEREVQLINQLQNWEHIIALQSGVSFQNIDTDSPVSLVKAKQCLATLVSTSSRLVGKRGQLIGDDLKGSIKTTLDNFNTLLAERAKISALLASATSASELLGVRPANNSALSNKLDEISLLSVDLNETDNKLIELGKSSTRIVTSIKKKLEENGKK